MKQIYLKFSMLLLCMVMGLSSAWAEDKGTITFGTNNVKINKASVTGKDDLGNTWTITTEGTESFTQQPTFSQVGAKTAPATSITFTTTLPAETELKSVSAKFGGFSGTAGNVSITVDEEGIGEGGLNGTADVTIASTKSAKGKVITVTVTDIDKGVKCYNITYTYAGEGGETPSTPVYNVNIDNNITGGTISASLTSAAEGTEISLEATPYEGYELTSWYVLDADENEITVTDNKFSMPASDVEVSATFSETTPSGGNQDDKYTIITYNFNDATAYPKDFPTSGTNNVASAKTVTISGNPLIINAPTSYYIINSTTENRGLFFGKTKNSNSKPSEGTAYLGFPAQKGMKLVKIVATSTSAIAGGLPLNIYTTSLEAVSTPNNTVNGAKTSHTFVLNESKEDTEYWLTAGGASGKNLQFDKIVLYYENTNPETPAPTNFTFNPKAKTSNNTYWATFSCDRVVKFDEAFINDAESCMAEVKAYAVYAEDDAIICNDLYNITNDGNYTYIPKNTGVLLKFTLDEDSEFDGTVPFEYADDVDGYLNEVTNNYLQPASVSMSSLEGSYKFYKLTTKNGTDLGFYYGAEDGVAFDESKPLNPNTAYLAVPTSVAGSVKSFTLNNIADAIENISNKFDSQAPIYNVAGQRVSPNTKGILIQNGKKFFNK